MTHYEKYLLHRQEIMDRYGREFLYRQHIRRNPGQFSPRNLPRPDDFEDSYARLGSTGCAKHYSVGAKTIRRWRDESNLEPNGPTWRSDGQLRANRFTATLSGEGGFGVGSG